MSSGNRHYANGANFERRVAERLREQGWTVFRVAGSHTPADLIAVWPFKILEMTGSRVGLVQCKGGVSTLGPTARREFSEYASALGADAILAERGLKLSLLSGDGGRLPWPGDTT